MRDDIVLQRCISFAGVCKHITLKKVRFQTNIFLIQSGVYLYYQHYLDTSLLILRQFSTIKSVISHIDQVYNGKNLKRARMLTFRNLNLVQVARFCFLLSVTKIEIVCFKKAEIHKLNKLTQVQATWCSEKNMPKHFVPQVYIKLKWYYESLSHFYSPSADWANVQITTIMALL